MLELTRLGRLDDLVVGLDRLLQLVPQLIRILAERLDLALPPLLGFSQLLRLLAQPDDLQAALL